MLSPRLHLPSDSVEEGAVPRLGSYVDQIGSEQESYGGLAPS